MDMIWNYGDIKPVIWQILLSIIDPRTTETIWQIKLHIYMISLFELVLHYRKNKRQEYRKYTEAMWWGSPKRNHKAYFFATQRPYHTVSRALNADDANQKFVRVFASYFPNVAFYEAYC